MWAKKWQHLNPFISRAGQGGVVKTLPNGNKLERITTVYNNSKPTLGIETAIYSPKGELLKAYAGIRTSTGTQVYQSGKPEDLKKALNNMYANQGEMKSLFYKKYEIL